MKSKELTDSIKQRAYWEIELLFRSDPAGGYHVFNASHKAKVQRFAEVLTLPDSSPDLIPLARRLRLLDPDYNVEHGGRGQ